MTSSLRTIKRLGQRLAGHATNWLTVPLNAWDLQLDEREIERDLAYGRD